MPNTVLQSDRVAEACLRRRRRVENERRDRIFDDRERTIGIDKEALDMQIKEKKEKEEARQAEKKSQDAEWQQNSRVAWLLDRKQARDRQAMERATSAYWNQQQRLQGQAEENAGGGGQTEMSIPGLVGMDQEYAERQQRQRAQLREWLIQQQSEKAEERQKEKLERQQSDQNRVEMDKRVVQLHRAMMDKRRALATATKDYNLSKAKEKGQKGQLDGADEPPRPSVVGIPGLTAKSDWKPPPESQQEIVQFQKYQAEEKKKMELERQQEKERHDQARIDLGRAALLLERQQARMNKNLRQELDNTNAQLAQTQKEQMADIKRGHIDDSFFSYFNTCSR